MKQLLVLPIVAVLFAACGSGNVFSLEVGDCFEDIGTATEVTNVTKVDCAEPHFYEVYTIIELDDGDFPGDAAVEESAIQECFLGYEAYVGEAYGDSDLDFNWLVPTSGSWGGGDREITCLIYDFTGDQLIGSIKGSGF
jgi:hypothetical protein